MQDNGSGGPNNNLFDKIRSGQLPLPLIGGLATAIVVGIIIVAVALGSGGSNDNNTATTSGSSGGRPASAASPTSISGGLQTSQPTTEATIDLARETAEAPNLTQLTSGDRIIISKIGVNAPLTYRKVDLDGVMPNPDGPDDVAYYDFSSWPGKGGAPGQGGNSIFAGHVDSGTKACDNGSKPPPCTAVLWDLNQLHIGDEIDVQINGKMIKYKVTSNQPINANSGPWDQIVSATATESLTIITCGGDFNRDTHEYNNRQVLTAQRET
jgi:LPXTG-site transpeptidase (sortase) family protein